MFHQESILMYVFIKQSLLSKEGVSPGCIIPMHLFLSTIITQFEGHLRQSSRPTYDTTCADPELHSPSKLRKQKQLHDNVLLSVRTNLNWSGMRGASIFLFFFICTLYFGECMQWPAYYRLRSKYIREPGNLDPKPWNPFPRIRQALSFFSITPCTPCRVPPSPWLSPPLVFEGKIYSVNVYIFIQCLYSKKLFNIAF